MSALSRLAVNDEGFVFDPTTGDSFHISATGLQIMKGMREGTDDRKIAQQLAETFEVTLENAMRDVADFRVQLKSLALV
jgi:hypothetical protein